LSEFEGIDVRGECYAEKGGGKKRARPEAELYRGLQDLQSGRKFSKRE
jgi:hypothetical protein